MIEFTHLKFRPNQFKRLEHEDSRENAAADANDVLDFILPQCPVVFGDRGMTEWTRTPKDEKNYIAIPSNFKNSYYRGLIINIEKIVNEQCKHEPLRVLDSDGYWLLIEKCKHCGVKLTATWSASK